MAWPNLEYQRAVMSGGNPQPAIEERNLPRFHQPFQQESIPGAIIGAILSASPVGQNLTQNINAYRNRDVGPAMQQEAARQFRNIGTQRAVHMAQLIEQNPAIADRNAQLYGGWAQAFDAMTEEARTASDSRIFMSWMRKPEAERTPEAFPKFATGMGMTPDRAMAYASKLGDIEEKLGPLMSVATTAHPEGEYMTRAEALHKAVGRAKSGNGKGGLTLAQQANNDEIDKAREAVRRWQKTKNFDREKMRTIAGRGEEDWREALKAGLLQGKGDWPYYSWMFKKAAQRKVGEDTDYESFMDETVGLGEKLPDSSLPREQYRAQLKAGAVYKINGRYYTWNPEAGQEGMFVEAF